MNDNEAVFEQAHTPTGDEREALARLMCEKEDSGTYSEDEGTCSWHFELADAVLDAGFRRPVQGEPTDQIQLVDNRDPECVKAWPGCHTFGYDPACCRFPKSCSAGTIATVTNTESEGEFAPGECDGSGTCSAPIHVHGCYTPHRSDQCDSPDEYGHIDSGSEGKA